jgi:hypothetical protein
VQRRRPGDGLTWWQGVLALFLALATFLLVAHESAAQKSGSTDSPIKQTEKTVEKTTETTEKTAETTEKSVESTTDSRSSTANGTTQEGTIVVQQQSTTVAEPKVQRPATKRGSSVQDTVESTQASVGPIIRAAVPPAEQTAPPEPPDQQPIHEQPVAEQPVLARSAPPGRPRVSFVARQAVAPPTRGQPLTERPAEETTGEEAAAEDTPLEEQAVDDQTAAVESAIEDLPKVPQPVQLAAPEQALFAFATATPTAVPREASAEAAVEPAAEQLDEPTAPPNTIGETPATAIPGAEGALELAVAGVRRLGEVLPSGLPSMGEPSPAFVAALLVGLLGLGLGLRRLGRKQTRSL